MDKLTVTQADRNAAVAFDGAGMNFDGYSREERLSVLEEAFAAVRLATLDALQTPSDAMIEAGCEVLAFIADTDYAPLIWQAMLSQARKEADAT